MMSQNNKWEQWLESEEGKKALEPSIVKPELQQYLKNRLWYAFHAGNFPIDGHLETKAESLLKKAISYEGNYLSKKVKREIEDYLRTKKSPAPGKEQ